MKGTGAKRNVCPGSCVSTGAKFPVAPVESAPMHVMGYLLENDLISNKQYGSVKGRSTMLQPLHIMDKWTDYLENGGQIDTIYTDFEKAFDKVPHRRLIYKLRAYDISNSLINWILDFFTARQQRVRVNRSISAWGAVTSGIP